MTKHLEGMKSPTRKAGGLRRVMLALVVLLLASALLVGTGAAETYYVNVTTGVDTNDGSESAPFATLQKAIDTTASGDKVKLQTNIEVVTPLVIAADDELIIDLNGKIISYYPTIAETTRTITNNGKLTIMDSTASEGGYNTGKITSDAANPDTAEIPGYASNTIVNGGTLILESGIIECTTDGGYACYAIDTAWYSDASSSGPTVIINGGKVYSENTNAIRMVGYATSVSNTLTINGGEIEGTRAVWIHLPDKTNEESRAVNLNINGGELTGSAGNAIYTYSFGNAYSGTKIEITGGEFNGDVALGGGYSEGGKGAEKLTVTGGTFNGKVHTHNIAEEATKAITISGGTFSEVPEGTIDDTQYNKVEIAEDTWFIGSPINGLEPQTKTYTGSEVTYDVDTKYSVVYSQAGKFIEPTNVGKYNVTVFHAASGSTDKAEAQTITNGLEIKPATLTATYAGETITVGETPKLTVTVTGFAKGQTPAGYVAPTLSNDNTTVGSYVLTPSGGTATANYVFKYVSGTLTIKEVPSSGGSSGSQGSSVWLQEIPTQTPTQTPTAEPTDVAPTDIPSTQPTATETTKSPGFGLLAALAGLGAVAVLRRK